MILDRTVTGCVDRLYLRDGGTLNILIVGTGGREHALGHALARHGHRIFTEAHGGRGNPGLLALGTPVDASIGPLTADTIVQAAAGMDLVVIGPEAPLVAGFTDRLIAAGIPAFGPTAAAARLEASKVFTRRFALRHGIPGPEFRVLAPGEPFTADRAWVIKLDGLAAGKGVWVCRDAAETQAAIDRARALRPGEPLLLEAPLTGPELSLLALCDGTRAAPLIAARDHKRRFAADLGPNTGGMGAVAPVDSPHTAECAALLQRAVDGMRAEGVPFSGVLYGGFMLTPDGPRLLEFNVRFGDPECQPLMSLWDGDPAPWLLGAATGRLPEGNPPFLAAHACCVVVCGIGYPDQSVYAHIDILPEDTSDISGDLTVYHAGTRLVDGQLYASGGRILGVTATAPTAEAARARALAAAAEVRFEGAAWRDDIGQ